MVTPYIAFSVFVSLQEHSAARIRMIPFIKEMDDTGERGEFGCSGGLCNPLFPEDPESSFRLKT